MYSEAANVVSWNNGRMGKTSAMLFSSESVTPISFGSWDITCFVAKEVGGGFGGLSIPQTKIQTPQIEI